MYRNVHFIALSEKIWFLYRIEIFISLTIPSLFHGAHLQVELVRFFKTFFQRTNFGSERNSLMLIKVGRIFALPGQRPNWRFSQWAAKDENMRTIPLSVRSLLLPCFSPYSHSSGVCLQLKLPCVSVCLSVPFVGLNLTSTIWRCKHASLTHFATHCLYVTLTFLYRYPHKCVRKYMYYI